RLRFSGPKTSIICSPMTSLKTSIKTITYLSDIGCLEIQGASLDAQAEIRRLQKELKRVTDERDILKKAVVDSIGQRNSYVKTWGCRGFLNETNIYSRGKSLCF
ncbi:hypothetical protein GP676_23510, partial [Escherichia coli]|nr:hypothetical protein [Escherichia coli]